MTRFAIPTPEREFDLRMEDGAVIRVRRHGNVDGPRVVLSHGNGFAIDGYFPFWRLLTERCEVVLFDLRNYGRNPPHGAEGHDFPHMVRDLDRIRDGIDATLGPKATIGAFHSLSACVNARRVRDFGCLWDALVLFDPPIVPPPGHPLHDVAAEELRVLAAWARTRQSRFADPKELAAQYAETRVLRHWVAGAHELAARTVLRRDGVDGGWVLACPGELEARMYEDDITLDVWLRREDFSRPFRLICSDPSQDHAQSPAHNLVAMKNEGGLDYIMIPGTGHFLQIERPEACADALFDFMRDIGIDP